MKKALKWLDKRRMIIPAFLAGFSLVTCGALRIAQRDVNYTVKYVASSVSEFYSGKPSISLSGLEKLALNPKSKENIKMIISLDRAKDYTEFGGDLFLHEGVLQVYPISSKHEFEAKNSNGRMRGVNDNLYFDSSVSERQMLYFHNPQRGEYLGGFHIHPFSGGVRQTDLEVEHNSGTSFIMVDKQISFEVYQLFNKEILGKFEVKN